MTFRDFRDCGAWQEHQPRGFEEGGEPKLVVCGDGGGEDAASHRTGNV